MGEATLSSRASMHGVSLPGRGTEEEIRRLEKRAMDRPEARDEILCSLDLYARGMRGTSVGRAARAAMTRIAAVVMLEALCEDGKEPEW
jgi:hypothetical protein